MRYRQALSRAASLCAQLTKGALNVMELVTYDCPAHGRGMLPRGMMTDLDTRFKTSR